MSPQLPNCSECTTTSAGGNCASIIVNDGYCADDATSRPLMHRIVLLCDGTVVQGIYELDGTSFAGTAKKCDPLCCPDGTATAAEEFFVPLDREQITVSNTVVTLVPPAGARVALIENIPTSAGSIRWTDVDGAPVGGGVAGFGHYLVPGATFEYRGDIPSFSMIRDGASDATIEVTYYDVTT